MTGARYFECENCGQVVQGFNAMQQIDCCKNPDFVEIFGPEGLQHLQIDLAEYIAELPLTKSGNYRKDN